MKCSLFWGNSQERRFSKIGLFECIDAKGEDFEKINENHPLNTSRKGL